MSAMLEQILKLHLDPEMGARYWLDKQRELGFSICKRIQSLEDLHELGPFNLKVLSERPLTDFIPKSVLNNNRLIIGETGGATGMPKTTAYCEDEFQAVFIAPFLAVSGWKKSDGQAHWLWLGPSGPHIIGKAARHIALNTTGFDGFSVDFDPRWYRALTQGSIARTRYLEHLIMQALQIVEQQNIHYLFSTPVMLIEMAKNMQDKHRESIEFIYLGGMPIVTSTLTTLGEAFPNAQFLSGYGNTLFGVSHEIAPHRPDNKVPVYFPPADRISINLISMDKDKSDIERLRHPIEPGERGQVVMHRLDKSCFLANVIERDSAIRINSVDGSGIADPQPVQNEQFKVEKGIY